MFQHVTIAMMQFSPSGIDEYHVFGNNTEIALKKVQKERKKGNLC